MPQAASTATSSGFTEQEVAQFSSPPVPIPAPQSASPQAREVPGPLSASSGFAPQQIAGFGEGGLPIGLSLAGRPWEEETVLRAAHAYQGATDWHTRRPPVGVPLD